MSSSRSTLFGDHMRSPSEKSPNVSSSAEHPTSPLLRGDVSDDTRSPIPATPLRKSQQTHPRLTISLTFLAAVCLAAAQHFFFQVIEGRVVTSVPIPEFWIRDAGSALATIAASLMAHIITIAFAQLLWYLVRRYTFTVETLDLFFDGPSIWSTLRIIFSVSKVKPIPALVFFLCTVCVQALVLVTIFTPNALTIGLPVPRSAGLNISVLNLSLPVENGGWGNTTDLANDWTRTITSGAASLPLPPGCGLSCQYSLVYQAPALQCTDIPLDAISNGTDMLNSSLTQAILVRDSGTYFNASWPSLPEYPTDGVPGFTVVYSPRTRFQVVNNGSEEIAIPVAEVLNAIGTNCTLQAANYNTSFVLNTTTGTQSITPKVLSYDGILNLTDPSASPAHVANIENFTVWSDEIFEYWLSFLGGVQCGVNNVTCGGTGAAYTRVMELPLFTETTDEIIGVNVTIYMSPSGGVSPNLSEALEQLFAISTLIMSEQFSTPATVTALVQDAEPVYIYAARTLILVYGLALGTTLACAALGLACLHVDGVPGSTYFSQILVTTRGAELDGFAEGAEEGSAYLSPSEKKRRLRFEGATPFARPGFKLAL